MKNHPVSHMLLSTALGVLLLAGSAAAHPGHPGHDGVGISSAETFPDAAHLSIAFVVACIALFACRGISRRFP